MNHYQNTPRDWVNLALQPIADKTVIAGLNQEIFIKNFKK
jgi:hypothetical protein